MRAVEVVDAEPRQLVQHSILFEPLLHRRGRVTIFERPRHDHNYVIGVDTALGLAGRDYDSAVVLDKETQPIRQVAEIHGHWGERFHRIVFSLVRYYNEAFVVAERATLGLALLRALIDDYGHAWVYYEREEASRVRREKARADRLGYAKTTGVEDPALTWLRRAIADGDVFLVGDELLAQLANLQYRPRSESMLDEEATDRDLIVKLATGGSPDLVIAASMAWWGVREIHHFPKPEPRYEYGTAGDILRHAETLPLDPEDPRADPFKRRRTRRS